MIDALSDPLFELTLLRNLPHLLDQTAGNAAPQQFFLEGLGVMSRELAEPVDPANGFSRASAILLAGQQTNSRVTTLSVWHGQKGVWRQVATSDSRTLVESEVPTEWMADVLDREQPDLQFPYVAWNMRSEPWRDRVLLWQWSQIEAARDFMKNAAAWAAALEALLVVDSQLAGCLEYSRHLLDLLEHTVQWDRSEDTESLLRQIAETATQWIPSQRATIFLWDRPNRQLVGRPALGIDDDELRVPDDAGLVGQVVRSGQPGRVDEDIAQDQAQVDRRTDHKLNFRTRSLVCVPLWDNQGRCLGAFELINCLAGNFTDHDQRSLELLAKHASIALSNLHRVEKLVTTKKTTASQAAKAVQLRGSSPLIETLRQSLTRVAPTDLTVLLLGENGTGKEVAAQLLHYQSQRCDEVLVAVNCAAIPDTLLESELFGHEKGAFTDAVETRAGKFELASQGTIFLDEIGDMSLSGQAKLLRVLEEKTIVRVGGSKTIPTQARVVAATNQDLAELVRQRKFREDLFFRLNVVTLEIPPLRLRGNDIFELANYFLDTFAVLARRPKPQLTPEAEQLLLRHPWPGNVRELRNMMERIAFLSSSTVVTPDDLSFLTLTRPRSEEAASQFDLELPLTEATKNFQTDYISRQIQSVGGNMSLAAQKMGLHRTNLYRKMKQLGMDDVA